MATLTVHPRQGAPLQAWRDGAPLIHGAVLDQAQAIINAGQPLLLTPEGPEVAPGWDTIEAAVVLLREVFWPCTIEGDPPFLSGRGNVA